GDHGNQPARDGEPRGIREDRHRGPARRRHGDLLLRSDPGAAQPRDGHGRVSGPRPMKARILVVDDEAEIRRSVRMILEYEGYEVLEASSGPEGLGMAERDSPDLVFLDIKMPGMDGLEALQRIKAANESLPVVIISGHGTVSTAVEATKAGAFDFIEKPLASERVLVTIRNALDQTRLRDENRSLKRAAEVRHQMVG